MMVGFINSAPLQSLKCPGLHILAQDDCLLEEWGNSHYCLGGLTHASPFMTKQNVSHRFVWYL